MKHKERYTIFHDGNDWVAITTEFKNLSGCASTPKEALRELSCAVACARKIVKEIHASVGKGELK